MSPGPRPIRRRPNRRAGWTLAELLVVVGIIGVLIALVVPAVSRAREASRQVTCLSNLRQLGVAFQLANQNDGKLPYPAFTQVPWERTLSRFVPLLTFRCPSDAELAPATGSSYDWRDTGVNETTLAGRSLREAASNHVLAFEALPGWHAKGRMGAVLVNGSAVSMTQESCLADLEQPVTTATGGKP